jgi:hypothetical protein
LLLLGLAGLGLARGLLVDLIITLFVGLVLKLIAFVFVETSNEIVFTAGALALGNNVGPG